MTGLDAAEGLGAKFANDGGRFGVESTSVEVVAEEIEARGTDLLAGGWGWWEVTGLATGCRAGIVPTRTGLVDEARRAEFLVERLDLVGFTWIGLDGVGLWSRGLGAGVRGDGGIRFKGWDEGFAILGQSAGLVFLGDVFQTGESKRKGKGGEKLRTTEKLQNSRSKLQRKFKFQASGKTRVAASGNRRRLDQCSERQIATMRGWHETVFGGVGFVAGAAVPAIPLWRDSQVSRFEPSHGRQVPPPIRLAAMQGWGARAKPPWGGVNDE